MFDQQDFLPCRTLMRDRDDMPTVFLDFDGTVSCADVVDAILEQYASPEWLRVEEEWREGRLGSRECLRQQMALVRATPAAIDAIIDGIGIDPGFGALLESCAIGSVPIHIISDGFDYCIRRMLSRAPAALQPALHSVEVRASHLEPAAHGAWFTAFPFPEESCIHGCATCKPAIMQALTPSGGTTVFVGDGLSDRYAAAAADLVFAKDKLASYCIEQGIVHVPFTSLADVAVELNERFRSRVATRRPRAARVGA
jgi:2-hydroxy-3-keto-5-methylthiopentenyl-1-phosphate phosphatase